MRYVKANAWLTEHMHCFHYLEKRKYDRLYMKTTFKIKIKIYFASKQRLHADCR